MAERRFKELERKGKINVKSRKIFLDYIGRYRTQLEDFERFSEKDIDTVVEQCPYLLAIPKAHIKSALRSTRPGTFTLSCFILIEYRNHYV